jgi:hypothetical protein
MFTFFTKSLNVGIIKVEALMRGILLVIMAYVGEEVKHQELMILEAWQINP